jgi:tetratricopeptide (TPR) repeat protein
MDRGMGRFWRILGLFAFLVGSFYFFSVLPWILRPKEPTLQQTQMAAPAPIRLNLPEPRPRLSPSPNGEWVLPAGENLCVPNKPDPNCVPSGMDRVADLIDSGRAEEARDLLLDLLKGHPRNVHLTNTLGLVYRHRFDDSELAGRYFRQALQTNPERADIAASLGELFAETRNFEEGQRFFRALVVKNPGNASLKVTLAELELTDGSLDRGITHLQQALSLEPDRASVYEMLADAQIRAGRHEGAATTLNRLLANFRAERRALAARGETTETVDLDIERVRAKLSELLVD